jgi:D-amino peptidase
MEGIAGVVSWKEYENDFARYRKLFTQEVKAVCEGILESGAKVERILVCDAHGSALSLLVEELPDIVQVSRGSGRPLMMLDGIDNTFSLLLMVGYHSGAGTAQSLMDHTYSSRSFYRVLVNSRETDEAMINAALAGHFGVPVGFVSGDDKLVDRARKEFPGIETVTTKQAVSRFAAVVRHPSVVLEELKDKAARAASRAQSFQPYRLPAAKDGSCRLEMQLLDTAIADMVALIPGSTRPEGRTVVCEAENMLGVYRTLRLAAILAGTASTYL